MIGGGLVGMMTAYFLNREGLTVDLLERGETCRESSWAGGGIISPLVISVSSYFSCDASTPLLITAIIFHTIGAIALKYILLKAGIHNPILPIKTSAYY